VGPVVYDLRSASGDKGRIASWALTICAGLGLNADAISVGVSHGNTRSHKPLLPSISISIFFGLPASGASVRVTLRDPRHRQTLIPAS